MSDNQKKEWDKEAFRSDLGHKAQVDRWEQSGEKVFNANFELQRIGHALKQGAAELREHEYLGSVAVHYYLTPKLQTPVFISQTGTIGRTPEVLVQHGITDLRNALLELYGHQPQRKRSGF